MQNALAVAVAVLTLLISVGAAEARGSRAYYADGVYRCHCRHSYGNGRTDPMLRYVHVHRGRLSRY